VRKYWKCFLSTLKHKFYVLIAGMWLGVPLWQLLAHDISKFSVAEFPRYARYYFGQEKDRGEWAKAWHHHQRLNAHHPEYWLLSWRFCGGVGQPVADNVVVLPMPEMYVREMVADWFAASKIYTGRWDIATWLNKNGPKMIMHKGTVRLVGDIMVEMGYYLTDNCSWSWMAGERFLRK